MESWWLYASLLYIPYRLTEPAKGGGSQDTHGFCEKFGMFEAAYRIATINIPNTHSPYVTPLLQWIPLVEPIRQWLPAQPSDPLVCTTLSSWGDISGLVVIVEDRALAGGPK